MGNRAECPVCGAYSSSVWSQIQQGKGCPDCEASYEILRKYQSLQEDIEKLQETRFNREAIKEIEKTKKENIVLRGASEAALNSLVESNAVCALMKAITILRKSVYNEFNETQNDLEIVSVPVRIFITLWKDKQITTQQLIDILRNERDYEECMELLERNGIERNSLRGEFHL